MLRRQHAATAGLAVLFVALVSSAEAWQGADNFKPPADVAMRKATIVSEGTRMAAEIYSPKEPASEKLPTIVMAHGWGGVAAHLRPDAVAFAARVIWSWCLTTAAGAPVIRASC